MKRVLALLLGLAAGAAASTVYSGCDCAQYAFPESGTFHGSNADRESTLEVTSTSVVETFEKDGHAYVITYADVE
jgi:hypothetical protein